MIYIENIPDWGFGNKILYYNNLRQLAHMKQERWSCTPWLGHQYFTGDLLNPIPRDGHKLGPCLGENFFKWALLPTRDIFNLKTKLDIPPNTCAIHFRGTDFHQWNPKSILNVDYYLNSIDVVKDSVTQFMLFTDDVNLSSFNDVKTKLADEDINFNCGDNTSNRNLFIRDFTLMSECDYIISSPSTFCICTGFIGKKKNIIHSAEWVKHRVNKNDKFWVDLYNGGNDNYNIWKLI